MMIVRLSMVSLLFRFLGMGTLLGSVILHRELWSLNKSRAAFVESPVLAMMKGRYSGIRALRGLDLQGRREFGDEAFGAQDRAFSARKERRLTWSSTIKPGRFTHQCAFEYSHGD